MVYGNMKKNISKFKKNDVVKVLPNVKDPDFKTNLGGWTGRVEEVVLSDSGGWLYTIRWNKETLSKAGSRYVDKCENENLDYEIIFLNEKELELTGSSKTKKDIDFSVIEPHHFFSNKNEKTKFNWFAFELASEIDRAVPFKLKKYLSKKGYTKQSFNRSCVKLAGLLQEMVLRKLRNEIPEMQINYTEVEIAFPGLNDKTVNMLLDCTSTAWVQLLDICASCPSACVSNKDDYCQMFDDKSYYSG